MIHSLSAYLKYGVYAICLLSLGSCIPEMPEEINLNVRPQSGLWTNPTFKKIYNFQDQLLTDSLLPFLNNEDPTWRVVAARSFASVRDSEAIPGLCRLLQDTVLEVREAAAFSLGQIGDVAAEDCLIGAFDAATNDRIRLQLNGAILEALGKCGSEKTMKFLASVNSYSPNDTALLMGQVLGLYRFGLRALHAPEGTKRMVLITGNSQYPGEVRLMSAHYLARIKDLALDTFKNELIPLFLKEKNAEIRMVLAVILGKINRVEAENALLYRFAEENDSRVKINILRALKNKNYPFARTAAYKSLKASDQSLSREAGSFFLEKGIAAEAKTYWTLASDSLISWPVRALLYAAANRHLYQRDTIGKEKYRLNAEIKTRYLTAENPEAKAAFLKALGEYGRNYRFIRQQMWEAQDYRVKTAAAESLSALCAAENFDRQFRKNRKFVEKELAFIFQEAFSIQDAGISAVAAGALRNKDRNFRTILPDISFLDSALMQLILPREQETKQEIEATIAFWNGSNSFKPKQPVFNHPIKWSTLANISNTVEAIMTLEKGTVILELYPDVAPATVANFIDLSKSGFFKGKNFHRIVPGFVSQGGCPRGDGYGSLSYSIRSELYPIYYNQPGRLGMASAGNHTEGTQFFITHAATPHLDGNYTLFGQVKSGFSLVSQLTPGDKIINISIRD
jgi:cyclophilin family peptidyl-prolyl cis-trans isomerase/HEAT repeat protein